MAVRANNDSRIRHRAILRSMSSMSWLMGRPSCVESIGGSVARGPAQVKRWPGVRLGGSPARPARAQYSLELEPPSHVVRRPRLAETPADPEQPQGRLQERVVVEESRRDRAGRRGGADRDGHDVARLVGRVGRAVFAEGEPSNIAALSQGLPSATVPGILAA